MTWTFIESNSTLIINSGPTVKGPPEYNSTAVHVLVYGDVLNVVDEAFRNYTNLETLELPDSIISIGNSVIHSTKLKTFHIPFNLKNISPKGSFDWQYTLEEFTIDPNHQYFSVLDGVLYDKNFTTLMTYPSAKKSPIYSVSYGVTSFFDSSTNNICFLQHLLIPQTVTQVYNIMYASPTPNLPYINISIFRYDNQADSTFEKGEYAFVGISKPIYINYIHQEYYSTYYEVNQSLYIFTTNRNMSITYTDTYFYNISNLSSVIVGRGIRYLSHSCFSNSSILYIYDNKLCTQYVCRFPYYLKNIYLFLGLLV